MLTGNLLAVPSSYQRYNSSRQDTDRISNISLGEETIQLSAQTSRHITPAASTTDLLESDPRALIQEVNEIAARIDQSSYRTKDRGAKAWSQVLGGFLLFINCWGMVNSFGVFQAFYVEQILTEHSESQVAWIGSCQAFTLLASTMITGPLFDKGYGKVLIMIGSIGCAGGQAVIIFATKYFHFMLAQGVLMGASMGCMFIPAIAIILKYFKDKRAIATGLVTTGSSIGGIIFPITFQKVLERHGFRVANGIIASTMLTVSIAATLIIDVPRTSEPPRRALELQAFRQYSFSFYSLACFFGFMALYTPIFYGPMYAHRVSGMSVDTSLHMSAVLNGGSIVGRIIPGILADDQIWGVHFTLLFCTAGAASLGFLWTVVGSSKWAFITFAITYGAFSGGFVSLQALMVAELTPDLGRMGTRMGMNSFVGGSGLLVGQPLVGFLLWRWDWIGVKLFCGLGVTAAAVGVWCSTYWLQWVEIDREEGKVEETGLMGPLGDIERQPL